MGKATPTTRRENIQAREAFPDLVAQGQGQRSAASVGALPLCLLTYLDWNVCAAGHKREPRFSAAGEPGAP